MSPSIKDRAPGRTDDIFTRAPEVTRSNGLVTGRRSLAPDLHCRERGHLRIDTGRLGATEAGQSVPSAVTLTLTRTLNRSSSSLHAAFALAPAEQVVAVRRDGLIVPLTQLAVRIDGEGPEANEMALLADGDRLILTAHLAPQDYATARGYVAIDRCPALALALTFDISSEAMRRAAASLEGGRLLLRPELPVQGRVRTLASACPRSIAAHLTLEHHATGKGG